MRRRISLEPVCEINSGSRFLFQVRGRKSPELEAANSAVTQLLPDFARNCLKNKSSQEGFVSKYA